MWDGEEEMAWRMASRGLNGRRVQVSDYCSRGCRG